MSPQSSIAHYRIISKLGEGGMGEVWRATDTKLGRDVAIKILPEAFAQDPDRLARFTREAQVLAALNHTNIAAIYGVEERALVMELVEGATLAERIARGAMPLEEALPVAKQIAEALEYAHERGIIHRDLKPANVKIAPDGRVKLLDFGLAKALAGETAAADPRSSPTLTMRATLAGVIMGTAAYMSPEQARGQEANKRSDIWSFGVVLHEMLTGRTLFDAPTISDTLAAVLRADLDWSRLPGGLPPNIRTLLQRCLERDSNRRLRDIGDARLELEQPAMQPVAPPSQPAPRLRLLPWIATWIAGVILAIAAASIAVIHFGEAPPPAPLVRFLVAPPDKGNFNTWISLSPNGRQLAFTAAGPDGVSRVWLRPLDSVEARPLAGTEGTITSFWSPDSRFIVFQSTGKLKKIDVAGGPPQSLCNAGGVVLGGSWNQDGVIVFGGNGGPIMQVSSAGGAALPITRIEFSRQEGNHSDPIFLPDGRHFLYVRRSTLAEHSGIYAGSLGVQPAQQSLTRIQATDFSPAYAPPVRGGSLGHLLFLREGALMAQPFDHRRLQTAGEPVPIAEQVGTSITRAFFSVSANGVLAYRSGGSANTQLTWYDREGHVLGHAGDPGEYRDVALSPDATRVAHSLPFQAVSRQIWLLDIARGVNSPLTFQPEGAQSPAWSPDGKYVAFNSYRQAGLYVKATGTGASEQPVFRSGAFKFISDWSRDGHFLLYTEVGNQSDIFALPDPLDGGDRKPIPFANTEFNETGGQFSPDSRWVAYCSDESGKYEIYVRPFPPGGERSGKWMVSSGGGTQPRWRGDGKELFYLAPDRKLMAVDVKLEPVIQSAVPHPLIQTQAPTSANYMYQYDVTRDGQRFLVIVPATGPASAPATVELNWDARLKR